MIAENNFVIRYYASRVFFSFKGNVDRLKIIDFGLAKELGLYADRIPITMCGTLEFMSPEVMRRERDSTDELFCSSASVLLFLQVMKCSHASPASDLWSVGVVLYMMLSGGVSPFWAGSEYRTQRKIMRGIYDLEHPNFKVIRAAVSSRMLTRQGAGPFEVGNVRHYVL